MALQINQYAIEELGPIDPNTWFDIDAVDAPFESRKLKFSVLQSEVLGGISATNGLNNTAGAIKLGGVLTETTIVNGQTNDNLLQFKGGDIAAVAGKANSTLSFNNGAGSVSLFQRLSTDPANDFIEQLSDIANGIARFRYNSIVSNDDNNIKYGSTGVILSTDDEAGGNLMSYTQFSGVGTFAGSLVYQDGSQGTAGHVLTSTGTLGEIGWAAPGGDGDGIYDGSGSLSGATLVTQGGNLLTFDENIVIGDRLTVNGDGLSEGIISNGNIIQNGSSLSNAFEGKTSFGKATAPSFTLDVLGDGKFSVAGAGQHALRLNQNTLNQFTLSFQYLDVHKYGFYLDANQNLQLDTKMVLASNGNVGVNLGVNGVPSAKLHVNGDTLLSGATTLNTTIASVVGEVWTATGVAGQGSWQAAGGGADGNGIYTGTGATLANNHTVTMGGFTLDIDGGSLTLNTAATTQGYFLKNTLGNTIFQARENNTTNDGSLTLLASNGTTSLVSFNGATDFFNTGNDFGIRTSSPLANLHLTASAHNNGFSLYQTNGTTLAAKLNHVVNASVMASSFIMYRDNGTTAGIQLGGASATLSWIDDGNNLGIGLVSPAEKLHVNGVVRADTHFKVSTIKVVGSQGAGVADATDAASAITQLNALISRMEAHGLIATV